MGYKRILVPVDGSATSKAGLREAINLAKGQGAQLQLVHVADQHYIALMGMESSAAGMAEMMAGVKRAGHDILRSAKAAADKAGVKASSVLLETLTGPAADVIVKQAKKSGADLIVLGTHGRRGVRRLVMGSDAEQVVRNAPVPVMLVRAT
ncbi:MAG: universal stress protein [Betaproteobacteria bacterium]|nr:universal stress protein [Betaproteobacteria bacterium]MBV9362354.1 universal stress protein [Betaproteobacteria bacterium]